MGGILETGGYSLRCSFLTRIANHLRSKLTTLLLMVLLKYIILRVVSEWHKVIIRSGDRETVVGEFSFSFPTGMEFQKGVKL